MTFQNLTGSWDPSNENVPLAALAKQVFANRSKREEFLPYCLFGEAAWDAILVLYAEAPGLKHSAETLAQRLDLPVTTMARWITVLENEGLIEKRPVSLYEEGQAVRLSAAGTDALQAYLRSMTTTP